MIEISDYLKSPGEIGSTSPNAATFTTAKRTDAVDTADNTELIDLGTADTRYQAQDADLTAIAGLTSAEDTGIYFTGAGTAGTFTLTAAGRALLDDADAEAQRATLGIVDNVGVTGPESSTTDAIPRYVSTDGLSIKNSLVTISDAGVVNIPSGQTYNINGVAHAHDYAASNHNHDSTYIAGPASSTDNAVARFDLATGKLVQNSLVTISDVGTVNIPTGQTYNINGVEHTHTGFATTADIIALAIALGG